MAFKSLAQKRKFEEMLRQGKISRADFEEWSRGTTERSLPERVAPKRQPSGKVKTVKVIR